MNKILKILFIISIALSAFTKCAFFADDDFINPFGLQEEDGLSVLYLHPAPLSDSYIPAVLIYKGREYQVKVKKRGASSYGYPMNSYTVKFPLDSLFSDPEHGFYNKEKILLTTSFDDNSFIRTRLAFDIWNRMNSDHIQVETYSAVVYLNGVYHGLYTVTDHIDAELLIEEGFSGLGNLYKTVNHDANFTINEVLHSGFEKKEGLPKNGFEGAFDDLHEIIKFVNYSSNEEFLSSIDTVINVTNYIDWWIFGTLIQANDSMGKNVYHYHDPVTELWWCIPWDFNASFGQTWTSTRSPARSYYNYTTNKLFSRFLYEPVIYSEITSRYVDLLENNSELSLSWITGTIDSYYAEIHDAAVKSEFKWRKKYRAFWRDRIDFNNFEEEIEYIKEWIIDRHDFMINKFN